tara:strand:+ start:130 stop:960 length:831 start_codon:yes stop_codon:yes gene_type:complete
MKFRNEKNEIIFQSEITPEKSYMFQQDLESGLSIIWNRGNTATFRIDKQMVSFEKNCIIFLTEFHKIDSFDFEKMNVIQFNRPFHCVEENDLDTGCKGILFFGASDIPKIVIHEKPLRQFEMLWEIMMMEMEESDDLTTEMLRSLLKRWMILSVRIFKQQNQSIVTDTQNISLIREFNYLVEKNYKSLTKVSDYANLLFKSPKTISNIFNKYSAKSPINIINDRRLLEAKRALSYTDKNIQEISEELNFTDVQAFSHFFKARENVSPSLYRETILK